MQVFTFCEENYAKRAGAHPALSEMEQHEWDDLGTSESFKQAAWVSVENTGYTFTSLMKYILWLHRQILIYLVFTPPIGMQMINKVSIGAFIPCLQDSWLIGWLYFIHNLLLLWSNQIIIGWKCFLIHYFRCMRDIIYFTLLPMCFLVLMDYKTYKTGNQNTPL